MRYVNLPWKVNLSFAETPYQVSAFPARQSPKVLELFQIRLQCYSFSSYKDDVPGSQSRECHSSVVCNAGGSSLLRSSLQKRNFPNSMLAETPLGELVENTDKHLNCDWAQMENEH